MPTLLQINVTANWGSTGKIAEDIGKLLISKGWESHIAYGRGNSQSASHLIRIGNDFDMNIHGLQSRMFDNHGLASKHATKSFIKKIRNIKPDIIHLHNIHGYYLNYPLLFEYLKSWGGPVVWTLHDCWPFTGHCAYYDFGECNRWKDGCEKCPQLRSYPASYWADNSAVNYLKKKEAFLNCPNLTLVPVSHWLREELSKSFLYGYKCEAIHNGIDISVFHPCGKNKDKSGRFKILGVASVWDERKGLNEFLKLRERLNDDYDITLVGLNKKQISNLPSGISGIERTNNVDELVSLYSNADVYVNPTLEDNFPTTNLEALSCGTPVITYDTGGSPEAIDDRTGYIIPRQDVVSLAKKIEYIHENNPFKSIDCRKRAEDFYDKNKAFENYINLYKTLI